MKEDKKGFTLIEILAVIIILGIIMIIAVPAVSKYILKSNKSVYASNVSSYVETVRAKYEMEEYGKLLKDNEIMIVPIESIILEKGDVEESPYGKYIYDKSYVIIVPERNKYDFYATVIDETNIGLVKTASNSLGEKEVREDIDDEIPGISSFNGVGSIYEFNGKEYKRTEIRDIEGEDANQNIKAYVFREIAGEGDTSLVFKITLDNKGATTPGTRTLYELYSVGWYFDLTVNRKTQTITPPYKNGYEFLGYYTEENGHGTQIINKAGLIIAGKEKIYKTEGTMYAKWKECGDGYYSNDSLTCSICPEGYRDGTEVENKTRESACLKKVGAGKYIGTPMEKNPSTCAVNTFKNAHTVTYGGTSTCLACTTLGSGYTKSAGGTGDTGCYMTLTAGQYVKNEKDPTASSCAANQYSEGRTVYYGQKSQCSLCINLGITYTKSAGGTGPSGCYMEVAAGKYKTEATGTTTTNCAANKYSVKHNSYYGSTDTNSCKGCPGGYSSPAGSTAKTACTITCSENTRVTTADGTCTGGCTGGTTIAQHTVASGSTSNSCTSCTNGTGVATWGSNCNISTCSANYYKNGNECIACPAGYSSNAGSTAKSDCKITCGANTRVTTVDGKCTGGCSTGYEHAQHTVSAGSTSSACSARSISCGAKYYLRASDATCQACPSGSYCPGGTWTYDGNDKGKYGCPSGYSCGGSCSAKTQCYITCGANTRVTTGDGKCTGGCSTGYTIGSHTVYASNTSPSCSARSITCGAGKYLRASDATCQTCPATYYCPGGTWTYDGNDKGKNPCQSGFSSAAGASSCYDVQAPTIYPWSSTCTKNALTTKWSSKLTVCNLGTDNVKVTQVKYWTDCQSPSVAEVYSDGCASLTVFACKTGLLTYQILDARGNTSGPMPVTHYAEYFLLAGAYNHVLWPDGTCASNDSINIGNWVSNGNPLHLKVADIANAGSSPGSNRTFVERLYRGLLGREGETEGLNDHLSILDAGGTRVDRIWGFLGSTEGHDIYEAWGHGWENNPSNGSYCAKVKCTCKPENSNTSNSLAYQNYRSSIPDLCGDSVATAGACSYICAQKYGYCLYVNADACQSNC